MTLDEFYSKHMSVDWDSEDPIVTNLCVLNVKPGGECMRMCGLFNLPPTSLMIPGGGGSSMMDEQDYVSFVADENGNASSYVGNMYTPKKPIKAVYYPEIEPILDGLFRDYPQFIERMPGGEAREAESSDALYKLLGMEVQDD